MRTGGPPEAACRFWNQTSITVMLRRSSSCLQHVLGHLAAHEGRSGPFQARKDRASHYPVLVALRQEAQLFGEMGDALAVACLGKRIRDVGTPMAALRAEGVEQALQVHRHIAERIRFERIA